MQCVLPSRFFGATAGHDQSGPVVGSEKLCRHEKDMVAQSLECGALKLRGQTQPLEPIDQVVGQ